MGSMDDRPGAGDSDDDDDDDDEFVAGGGFTALDARHWLHLDETPAEVAEEEGDASAMLVAAVAKRYLFFNSFGGAAGMRKAVDDCMKAERGRMQAIQDAILGPLEARYGF